MKTIVKKVLPGTVKKVPVKPLKLTTVKPKVVKKAATKRAKVPTIKYKGRTYQQM